MSAVTKETKLTTVCLADFSDDSARDLNGIATPGSNTLLAEQCERNSQANTVPKIALYFVQQYSKQGKHVHIFAPSNHGWMADATANAGADNACIRHSILTKDLTAIDIVDEALKFDAKPALCVFMLPKELNGEQHREFMQAASDLAESGAAVLYLQRLIPLDHTHVGHPVILETAGASVDDYFHKAWVVQDKASAINMTRCNLLTPLYDPRAEQGYTFAIEGQRPVFNFQSRTKNARQSTSLVLPEFRLAIPNAN